MSLAYKLWKIGSVLTKDDIRKSIEDKSELTDPSYFNIDFIFKDGEIVDVKTTEESLANEEEKFFFTKKMGGSGRAIFYLYPNLQLQKSELSAKISLLINTVSLFVVNFSNAKNAELSKAISLYLKDFDKYMDKVKLDTMSESLKLSEKNKIRKNIEKFTNWVPPLIDLAHQLLKKDKGDYKFWFSVNGKTFFELMPEVWDNWFESPAIANDEARQGYDFFSNEFTTVGFRPEIKVFSYDNYHDSFNGRLIDNLPLSKQSARNIKFAWMYILDNLVFSYKWLEYILLPNIMMDDKTILEKIIRRLRQANMNTRKRQTNLNSIVKKEKKLVKDIESIEKKLKKSKAEKEQKQLDALKGRHSQIRNELAEHDMGLMRTFNSQIDEIGDLKHSITIDFLFTEIDRKNLSFSIKGSIEDVIPSRLNQVVEKMQAHSIDDNVKLGKRDRTKVFLQDYFNRDELFFATHRSAGKNKDSILKEKIYIARLLLTEINIKMSELLKRFEFNREYFYDRKRRLTKEGIKEWIEYSAQFSKNEAKLIAFLQELNKIQE